MKRILPGIAALILIGVFCLFLPPAKNTLGQTPKDKQMFDAPTKGTFVVTTREGGQGYPILNPKIVSIAGSPYLTGIRAGKIATHSSTIHTGGHTFFQLSWVVSIQQIPDAK